MASMRFALLAIVLLFPALVTAQEKDILDIIAEHPRSIQIHEEDGTIRVPKYFDRHNREGDDKSADVLYTTLHGSASHPLVSRIPERDPTK